MTPRKDMVFVGLQGILFLLFLWKGPYFFIFNESMQIIFLIVSGLGILTLLLSILQLNSSLSPFPTPRTNSQLITSGLYKYIRHPIYTGILMMGFGWALYSGSAFRLLIAFALLLLFYFKSQYEEILLRQHYPGYTNFAKTRGRFLPKF